MKLITRLGCIASILIGVGLSTTQSSLAGASYQLSPSRITLEPTGARSTDSFQVRNTGDEAAALEIHVTGRQVNVNGVETRPDAEDDFVVYPPQVIIQPGEAQTIRVSWLGDPNPTHELAYRLIVEQLPIQLEQSTTVSDRVMAQVTALFTYVASVYIAPSDVQPNVTLESATYQNLNNADMLVLQFNNQGTAHQLLSDLNLTLTPIGANGQPQANAAIHLAPEQLLGVNGENILAQSQRQFVIPWPDDLPIGTVQATFEIHPD